MLRNGDNEHISNRRNRAVQWSEATEGKSRIQDNYQIQAKQLSIPLAKADLHFEVIAHYPGPFYALLICIVYLFDSLHMNCLCDVT